MHDGNGNGILYPDANKPVQHIAQHVEQEYVIPEQDIELPDGWKYENRVFNYIKAQGDKFRIQYTMKGNHTFKQHFQNAVKKLLKEYPQSRNHPLLSIYADDGRLKSEIDINEPSIIPSLEFVLPEDVVYNQKTNSLIYDKRGKEGKERPKFYKKMALKQGLNLEQNYELFMSELLERCKNEPHYDIFLKKYEPNQNVQSTNKARIRVSHTIPHMPKNIESNQGPTMF
jgi:hypothetical protein